MSKKLDVSRRYDIRSLRKELKLSQEECAKAMGWSTRKFQRVESDAAVDQMFLFIVSLGEFKIPESLLDFFEIHGRTFDLKKYMI